MTRREQWETVRRLMQEQAQCRAAQRKAKTTVQYVPYTTNPISAADTFTRREQWDYVRSLMTEHPKFAAALLNPHDDEDEPRHDASPTAKFCDALALWGNDDADAAPTEWRAAFARAGLNAQGGIPSALIPYEHLQQEANRHEVV